MGHTTRHMIGAGSARKKKSPLSIPQSCGRRPRHRSSCSDKHGFAAIHKRTLRIETELLQRKKKKNNNKNAVGIAANRLCSEKLPPVFFFFFFVTRFLQALQMFAEMPLQKNKFEALMPQVPFPELCIFCYKFCTAATRRETGGV